MKQSLDMDSSSCIVVLIMVFSVWSTHVHCQNNTFVITDNGAVTGGVVDSKKALLNSWQKACKSGGTIIIPQGTYLLSEVELLGPCNGQINIIVNGTLKAPPNPVPNLGYWISFRNLKNISVYGRGTIDGNGASYWRSSARQSIITSLKLENVQSARVRDITLLNSKMFHMGVHNCRHVTVSKISIAAPHDSPNTDGIHVGLSDDVRIVGASIATGDDCISIGDGATNVNVTGVTCGPGHGLSIGSLGRYSGERDVGAVTITNSTLTGTQNGLRIKTWAPSTPATVYGVTYRHITMNNVGNPIVIDQYYCPSGNCTPGESSVAIKQVKFVDVRGSSSSAVGVKIMCSKRKPCGDIELSGVDLSYQGKPTTASCANADVRFLGANQVPSHC